VPAVLSLALVAGACSSDEKTADTKAAAPAETTKAAEATPTEAAAPTDAPAPTDAAAPTEAPAPAGDSPCVVTGSEATGEPIKVGSIQGKTGPDDFSSSGQGSKAFFDCVNANGGINGRPIEYLIEDDQWTPDVATAAAAKLIDDEEVVAFVGSSSFVECGVNAQTYEEKNIVVVAGTGVPRECWFAKNVSPVNSGPRISALGAAQYLQKTYGVTTMTCVAQAIPNVGEWVCKGVEDWGSTVGVEVRTVLHDPAQPDLPAVVADVMSTNPEGVLLMEPAGLAIAIMKVAEEQDAGSKAKWAGPTSQYLATFPATVGSYWNGKFDVQAELNEITSTGPDNVAWNATMDEYGQDSDPRDTFSQAGWLAAKIFTETLLAMDPADINRDSVSDAIRAVTNYQSDLMCTPWYFGPGDRHNANHAGRMVKINDAGEYELTQECEEVADAELADIFEDETEFNLVG
jgi:branched-chain amino acid transport system substrate-binding protein